MEIDGLSVQELFRLSMDRTMAQPIQVGMYERAKGNCINLGHTAKTMPAGVRSIGLPEWNADTMPLPCPDGSISEIWALHFLEHVDRPEHVLYECQRVLRPGGIMHICVPYGFSHLAAQDMTHRHQFNEDSWKTLFNNPYYDPSGVGHSWHMEIHFNMVMAIKGQNLALITQLIRN